MASAVSAVLLDERLFLSAALENWTVSAVKSEHSTIGE
jgi:hypothetical protein